MKVSGRGGRSVRRHLEELPFCLYGHFGSGFPNFFMLNGPNGPVGNFSLIDVAELQFAYIMQLVERVQRGECHEIAASQAAAARFDSDRKEAAKTTIWNTGCKSWYLDDTGLPTAWPWTFDRFREEMAKPRLDDYEMRLASKAK